jgi:predicted HTH domain antitoxin
MKQAVINYPESFPHLLKLSDREFAGELGFLAAAKIYELGRLTASQAARIAGMDRLSFLGQLHRIGVPAINLQDEEIEAEVAAARELAE